MRLPANFTFRLLLRQYQNSRDYEVIWAHAEHQHTVRACYIVWQFEARLEPSSCVKQNVSLVPKTYLAQNWTPALVLRRMSGPQNIYHPENRSGPKIKSTYLRISAEWKICYNLWTVVFSLVILLVATGFYNDIMTWKNVIHRRK